MLLSVKSFAQMHDASQEHLTCSGAELPAFQTLCQPARDGQPIPVVQQCATQEEGIEYSKVPLTADEGKLEQHQCPVTGLWEVCEVLNHAIGCKVRLVLKDC
eukprot:6488457-Amphidinium_carterae.2